MLLSRLSGDTKSSFSAEYFIFFAFFRAIKKLKMKRKERFKQITWYSICYALARRNHKVITLHSMRDVFVDGQIPCSLPCLFQLNACRRWVDASSIISLNCWGFVCINLIKRSLIVDAFKEAISLTSPNIIVVGRRPIKSSRLGSLTRRQNRDFK